MDYISRADFLEGEQNIYCVDCSRRKNSKGRTVWCDENCDNEDWKCWLKLFEVWNDNVRK